MLTCQTLVSPRGQYMHMLARQQPDGSTVVSIDLVRHHDEDGILPQRDILDELLADVEPLPFVAALPLPSPVQLPSENNEIRMSIPRVGTRRMRHGFLTDAIILKFVEVYGPRWRALARSLGGRAKGYSDDVVRNRYIRLMDAAGQPYETQRVRTKTPCKPERQVERWSEADDDLIFKGMQKHGGAHWGEIAKLFGGQRTQQAIRNRANRIGLCDPINAHTPPLPESPTTVTTVSVE